MKFSAPKKTTWWIATVLGVLGILGAYISIPFVSANAFLFLVFGFILFLLATLLKDL